MTSIDYYNTNAKGFITSTFSANMEQMYQGFLQFLEPGASILDIGCGSGRDSLWFKNKGYKVWAFDGSEEMVKHCKPFLGDNVCLATFEDYQTTQLFDGIWACASLLHVKREQLKEVVDKYTSLLIDGGIFFMSYKIREEDYEKDGRQFTNFTEASLEKFVDGCQSLYIESITATVDVREGRQDEGWISVIARKRVQES